MAEQIQIPPHRKDGDTGYFIKVEQLDLRTLSMLGLFTLALIVAMYLARPVLMPILLSLLLYLVVRPVHAALVRSKFHPVLASGLILLLLSAGVIWGVASLTKPAQEWIEEIPESIDRAREKIRGFLEPVGRVTEITEQVTELAQIKPEGEEPAVAVAVTENSTSDLILKVAHSVVSGFSITFFMLFFIMAYGARVTTRMRARSKAVVLAGEVGDHVSRYLFTITLINAGLGVCTGLAMYLLKMPNPALWGFMAFVLNFIPYVGAIVGVAIVFLVALITFDSTAHVVLVPATYLALTSLESYFVTPMVLGFRFTLNPIFLFVALVFWGWIWGIPGALMAVPLLMAFKIVCDHIRSLQWLSQMLSD